MNLKRDAYGYYVITIPEIGYEGFWGSYQAACLADEAYYTFGINSANLINRFVNRFRQA